MSNTCKEDFYQYVNRDWLENPDNKIPDDYSSWGGFTKLHDDIIKLQISLVKELEVKPECNTDETKILAIWKASQSLFKSWNQNIQDYQPVISELNLLSQNFNKNTPYILNLASYIHYTQINGITNILDFDSGSDLENVNNVVLDFSMGGLSLPTEYYYLPKYEDKLLQYQQHLENINNLCTSNSILLSSNFVNNVLQFESSISKFLMTPSQSREYDKYFTNTNLEDIYLNINQLKSLKAKENNYQTHKKCTLNSSEIEDIKIFMEALYQKFDFRNILKKNRNQNFSNLENKPSMYHITAYDGDAIRRCLQFILNPKNYEIYNSYMQYRIICSCSSFCSKMLDEEFFDFYQRKLGGQKQPKPLEKRSIGIVNSYSGEMLGKLFVKKHFSSSSKNNIESMIGEILLIMKQSLSNNDWLTHSTKEKALEKLSNFRTKIGYPNVWKDYSDFDIKIGDSLYKKKKKAKKWSLRVNFLEKINSLLDRDEWRMTPQTVNAYFMPTQNEIVFPAAIMHAPFFHQNLDTVDFDISEELLQLSDIPKNIKNLLIINSINYGGIGAVIAHEITHGYDDKGRKFDSKGNLNDWWSDTDTQLFTKKTELIVASVSKYAYEEPITKKIYNMDPQLTMGENLADIGGLSLSMQALLYHLNNIQNTSSESNVKILKPCLRIFFKSWANIWKQNITNEKRTMLLGVDPHGPTDFRGNLVQHMDMFYEVFDIKRGDKMYLEPEQRMKMW